MIGSPTILIVDDALVNSRMVQRILAGEGFRTLIAADGRSAVRITQKEQPDLILLDVLMPGEYGFETCHRLKSDPAAAAKSAEDEDKTCTSPPMLLITSRKLTVVAIYFSESSRRTLFGRLERILEPDGYLMIGSMESLASMPQFESKRYLRSVFHS